MVKLTREHIVMMLDYCKEKWGMSAYQNSFPKLRVYTSNPMSGRELSGTYNPETNLICIYLNNHPSVLELCDTIIHEYTHYLQNIEGMYEKYMTVYYRTYDNHPYEITARNRGAKYKWECYEYILQNEK